MPALLTLHTMPALSFSAHWGYAAKGGGIQLNRIFIGRSEVAQVDLGLPFGISESLWQKKCREALTMMADAGERYACLPPALWPQAREYGLLPCDALPALRRLAAEAVLDCMGSAAELGHVRIFARMPSREVMDCVCTLAERCRYVSVSGGEWARHAARMLLRDYGTAPPGKGTGGRQVLLAFDPGYDRRGEERVIDLSREGRADGDALRPGLGAGRHLQGLPRGRFYDAGPLLGHLYIHGALDRRDLRVWCRPTT